MIITLKKGASQKELDLVLEKIQKLGYKPHVSRGKDVTIIGMIGEYAEKYKDIFDSMEAVEHISEIQKPYKLASRQFHTENTIIKVSRSLEIGGKKIQVMAGPCAVEGKDIFFKTAKAAKEGGASILRGGAFKPRSSPYTFQGLGEKGLKIMKEAGKKYHMPIISEAMTVEQTVLLSKYCDIIQIGARNMQNYDLLKAVGKQSKPVLLKRGMSATIKEFLLSAEYILSQGNYNVMLCERGIRTFEDSTRFTLDLNAVPVLKKLTHLPIILDPSHGTGIREYVSTMAKASIAAGADGLIIEIHPNPEEAFSDGPQSLFPEQFAIMMKELNPIAQAVGRELLD
ncbi:MAG: 3-deoxy-7-phosphoheptulonate synthase [Elusimicrobiota bacterium]|jgi:3-deoxy-7-phosphoheptulonate synthase|nr:3-deoxy-7-phosphoheptulonate synthase [Elusimicrobiota bacterium]